MKKSDFSLIRPDKPRLKFSKLSQSQDGIALIESAFVIFFLVALFLSIFELGRMLYAYFVLNEIATEGARLASKISSLEQGPYSSTDSCIGSSHKLIHNRMLILGQLNKEYLPLQNLVVKSSCYNNNPSDPRLSNNVEIEISARYKGLFMIFDGKLLSAKEVSKYTLSTPCQVNICP